MSVSEPPAVWILDDSVIEAEAVARALATTYATTTFHDASDMMQRIAEGAVPEVLVLDWYMPSMSGGEVCAFLRDNSATAGLPVLVLTASHSDLVAALEVGADDYVSKPYNPGELHARVGALIRSHRLRKRAEDAEASFAAMLVSEKSARAAAEAANRSKDEFLATLSHELRTPLNAILGWTTLLRSETLEAHSRARALETIERNARLQARLVEDLLDVSRIVSDKLDIESLPVDLSAVVLAGVETVRPSAAAKRVSLTVPMDDSATYWVVGDARRLQQVLSNLLSNAVKFTASGGEIRVLVEATDAHAILRVSDDGRGIDAAFLPYVFERFRQADATSTRRHGGLGLGLAIVRHIVERHGGTVRAESAGEGKGATFTVTLPLQSVSRSSRPPERGARPASDLLMGVKVLVVDDDADGLEIVGALLRSVGATVTLAASADEAMRALAESVPDVIISDLAMPGKNGLELMRDIRSSRGALAELPAIALSATADSGSHRQSEVAGFDAYVAKPCDSSELLAVVADLARRKRARAD